MTRRYWQGARGFTALMATARLFVLAFTILGGLSATLSVMADANAQTRSTRDDGLIPPLGQPAPQTEPITTPEPTTADPASETQTTPVVRTRRTPYVAPPPLPDPRFAGTPVSAPTAEAQPTPTTGETGSEPPAQSQTPPTRTISEAPAPAASGETPPTPSVSAIQAPASITPHVADAPVSTDPVAVRLVSRLTVDGPEIPGGMAWRIYQIGDDGVTSDNLVMQGTGGPVATTLLPGNYMLHAAYGRAFVTRPINVTNAAQTIDVVMNAGGLLLRSAIDTETPLPQGDVRHEIRADDPENASNRRLVIDNVTDGEIVALVEGTYHIISHYGDANAIVRADLRVEAGQLTEAVIYHKAAEVTLKLVNEPNGEALANTTWTILTPGGDTVRDYVGAFPTLVLAEGAYTAIARHDGRIFNRDFQVVAGLNGEIEVVAQ